MVIEAFVSPMLLIGTLPYQCDTIRHREAYVTSANHLSQGYVITAFWETSPGEEGIIADLLRSFLPKAQKEPGVKDFQIHQNAAKPREFFFYEVFANEAAFADHQQTEHFKTIIQGQAIPKLVKRERSQFLFI